MASEVAILGAALVTGASLATSGAVLQTVFRNPLAEPYMLGTVGGAALCAAAALRLGLSGTGVLPLAAFAGACASLGLVCLVAHFANRLRTRRGADAAMRASHQSVVLAGFVTASFTGSLQMALLAKAPPETFAAFSKWLYGDLHAVSPGALVAGACLFAVVFAVLCAWAKKLDLYELGYDGMEVLGIDSRKLTVMALVLVSLLTATSVALAGAIGFVGLVAPHVVRRLTDGRHRVYLPLAAGAGALALVGAEYAGRLFPGGLSAGVICAICGAPLFFLLLALTRPE